MQLFPLLEADFQVTCPVTGRIIIPFCSYWESGTEPELPYTLENVVLSPRDPTVVPPSMCACVFVCICMRVSVRAKEICTQAQREREKEQTEAKGQCVLFFQHLLHYGLHCFKCNANEFHY